MDDIKVTKHSPLIRVLADTAMRKSVDTDKVEEANDIISEMLKEPNKAKLELIGDTIAFTLTDLQEHELDMFTPIADVRNVGYGQKVAFQVKNYNGLRAVWLAKGTTTPRSYVGERQFTVESEALSVRPAIQLTDLKCGRVDMSELLRAANHEITLQKLAKIEDTLQSAIGGGAYSSPFYDTGTGINKQLLDKQLQYFRGHGPVTILGDMAAVGLLSNVVGMVGTGGDIQRSFNMIDEYNQNGYIGRYIGCPVLALQNAYRPGEIKPILKDNWLYIIPGGLTPDTKNLKIINEGDVQAFEETDINDLRWNLRLDVWFGCTFVTAHNPTMGAYMIN